jgi:D-alanine-D-alanine ligase
MIMRVAFLYNDFTEDPAHTAEDPGGPEESPIVLALRRLGHTVTPIACTLDLAAVRRRLQALGPHVVFNRVESLGGSDALMPAVPMLLDAMGLPYTGCPAEPQLATASKLVTKQRLAAASLPTPAWITADYGFCRVAGGERPRAPSSLTAGGSLSLDHQPPDKCRYILKSVLEHASFQMDDDAVIGLANVQAIQSVIRDRQAKSGRPYFAEEYIDGREFNLALLGDEPLVLPPAEIDFSEFPSGKPRIVGHRAKCDAGSFEYHNTPRRFEFPSEDAALIERLQNLARECWRLFRLQGYARIDFRCDEAGEPWILEINTNPCLAPQAGFAAALAEAGISFDEGIQRLLEDALTRRLRIADCGFRIEESNPQSATRNPQFAAVVR